MTGETEMPDPIQLLGPDGGLRDDDRLPLDVDGVDLAGLYRDMVLTRRLDTEAIALQRQGELGLWPSLLGQEAAQIGAGRALRPQDMVFPTYREHGVAWCRDIDTGGLLSLFRGVTLGGWDPHEKNFANYTLVIGAQALHAVGYAMGIVRDGAVGTGDPERDTVAVAFLGDGALSEGETNEAFVWAAAQDLPVVFFCQNNQYAISAPYATQSRVPAAQRASGFGFGGVRVDGNDVLACLAATRQALDVARGGGGPTLVEAYTYRRNPHTTSDDAGRYREVMQDEFWSARDPLARVRALLSARGVTASFFSELDAQSQRLAERLRTDCRALPDPSAATPFETVYTQLPLELQRQLAEHLAYVATGEQA